MNCLASHVPWSHLDPTSTYLGASHQAHFMALTHPDPPLAELAALILTINAFLELLRLCSNSDRVDVVIRGHGPGHSINGTEGQNGAQLASRVFIYMSSD